MSRRRAQRPAPRTPAELPASEAAAWNAVSYIPAGLLLGGGAGYVLDRWLGTSWVVAVGLLSGLGLAIYVVWIRYGSPRQPGGHG